MEYNINEVLKQLEFEDINLNTISLNDLKHKYKFLSLKYHPDKNLKIDTTSKFQEISEAYKFMELYIIEREKKNNTYNNDDVDYSERNEKINNLFNNLFNNFEKIINGMIKNKKVSNKYSNTNIETTDCSFSQYSQCSFNYLFNKKDNIDNIFNLIRNILENTDLLNLIQYEYSINIVEILKIYKNELGVSIEKINEIEKIIKQKSNNDKEIKKINLIPNINNLLNCDLYKLTHEDILYYIPLWHNELVYEFDNHNLLIEINPQLDENITLDKNNNIHISIVESIIDIFSNKILTINIGNKILILDSEKLKIKEYQTHIFKKEGIPIINYNNIYDTSKKSNIILHLQLVF